MQNVNLYTDAFRPKRVLLPLEHIVLLPVIAVILLAGLTLMLDHSLEKEAAEIQLIKNQNDEMAKRLKLLSAKANRLQKDESLVAANKRLHEKAKARQQMIDVLDTVVVRDDAGFSNILLSLARQKLDKLWLNSIYIGSSGKDMHIQGQTLNADLVPAYLQQLRKEDSFLGRTFTLFELEQDANKNNVLKFSLKSQDQSATPEVLISQLDNSREILNYAIETVTGSAQEAEVEE